MNFSDVKSITIPEGKVRRITANGITIWEDNELISVEEDVNPSTL